jgi:hypothetical protein
MRLARILRIAMFRPLAPLCALSALTQKMPRIVAHPPAAKVVVHTKALAVIKAG